MGSGGSLTSVKRPGCKADHSPSNADEMNGLIYTSSTFHGLRLCTDEALNFKLSNEKNLRNHALDVICYVIWIKKRKVLEA